MKIVIAGGFFALGSILVFAAGVGGAAAGALVMQMALEKNKDEAVNAVADNVRETAEKLRGEETS